MSPLQVVLCLILTFHLVRPEAEELGDPNDAVTLRSYVSPGGQDSKIGTLEIKCQYDGSKSELRQPFKLQIKRSHVSRDYVDELMALRLEKETRNLLEESEVTATGTFGKDSLQNIQAELSVTYVADDDGFCRVYECQMYGWHGHPVASMKTVTKTITMNVPPGASCYPESKGVDSAVVDELKGKVDQCCESIEQIQKNTEALDHLAEAVETVNEIVETMGKNARVFKNLEQQINNVSEATQTNSDGLEHLESKVSDFFDTVSQKTLQCENLVKFQAQAIEAPLERVMHVMSINKGLYDVSSFYKGHVYAASKASPNFDLHEINELCKTLDGYLVEFDGQEEQKFVADFVTTLGNGIFATGANDVENEGDFVYYNSKKPMIDIVWKKNEPNSAFGNEDCVQVTAQGLNDIRCNLPRRYVCEIPVL